MKRTGSSRQFKDIAMESKRAAERGRMTLKPLSIGESRMARAHNSASAGKDDSTEDLPFTVAGGEEGETWIEDLSRDIYLGEAVAVLRDILSEKTGDIDSGAGRSPSSPVMPEFSDR